MRFKQNDNNLLGTYCMRRINQTIWLRYSRNINEVNGRIIMERLAADVIVVVGWGFQIKKISTNSL